MNDCITTTKQTQQNRVHISWDILYVGDNKLCYIGDTLYCWTDTINSLDYGWLAVIYEHMPPFMRICFKQAC